MNGTEIPGPGNGTGGPGRSDDSDGPGLPSGAGGPGPPSGTGGSGGRGTGRPAVRRRAVHSDDAPPPAGGYSKAIAAGPYLFTSGLGPQDPVTGEVAGTVEEQTRQVLANLRALLRADGLDLDDVVKSTVHLQHLRRDFAAYDRVYREHFGEPLPVRTTVGSDLMDILVEIDVVALRREP